MRSLLHRLRREDGIALPTVMGALVVTAMLATTTFAVSIDRQQTSVADRDGKRAAAAAQASLDLAFLRLTTAKPEPEQCVMVAAAAKLASGECPVHTELPDSTSALGNGAAMSYVVSTQGASGCRTLPAAVDGRTAAAKASDRCITATGTVNGVTRRLQTRVIYVPAFRPWASVGLVGKDSVTFDNNKIINSPVGSNGKVTAGNNTQILDKVVLPVGPPPAKYFGPTRPATEFEYPTVPFEFPDIDFSEARTTRLNQSSQGAAYTAWLNSVVAQGAVYNPTTRVLNIDDESGILEMPGGTYSFCQIIMRQNSQLRVKPNTGVMKIWIDAPRDSASGCGTGTGRIYLNNSAKMNVPAVGLPDATLLEVYVKGTQLNGNGMDIEFTNDNQFHGTIWAPFSTIASWNNGAMSGGMTGANVDMKNNGGFSYPDSIRNRTLPGTGTVRREGWFECSSKPTNPADNESGCST